MILRVFGDSYAKDHNEPWQWQHLLARYFDCDVEICANNGWSNEKIIYEYAQSQPAQDDWSIVITTDQTRHWFFDDHPEYTNWYNLKELSIDPSGKREHLALEMYTRYLLNPRVDAFNYVCHTAYLNSIGTDRTIHIPGFANDAKPVTVGNTTVLGTLTDTVSECEFADETHRRLWRQRGPDTRLNHLSRENHLILADKIAEVVQGNTTTIDLHTEFSRNFLYA